MDERGQASIELLAGLPALLLAGLIALQLLAAGRATTQADLAVEAGAMAMAAGRDPNAAMREALPDWPAGRVATDVDGGRLRVTLEPPLLSALGGSRIAVAADGWVRPSGR